MDLASPNVDTEPAPNEDMEPAPNEDTVPDPPFVMLEESDDEETIAQEELLEPEIDPQEELRLLANDLNVSLEELTAQSRSHRSRRNHKKVDYQAMLLEEQNRKKEQEASGNPESLVDMCLRMVEELKDLRDKTMPSTSSEGDPAGSSCDSEDPIPHVSALTKFYLMSSISYNEDEEGDADYKPMLKHVFNREVRMGPRYQVEVPEEPSVNSNRDTDSQCGDKLLWKPPCGLSEEQIDAYLCKINSLMQQVSSDETTSQRSTHRDNELALEVLLQCNFNEEMAINVFVNKLKQSVNGAMTSNETTSSKEKFENETDNSRENIVIGPNEEIEIVENGSENELPPPPPKIPKMNETNGNKWK